MFKEYKYLQDVLFRFFGNVFTNYKFAWNILLNLKIKNWSKFWERRHYNSIQNISSCSTKDFYSKLSPIKYKEMLV